MKKVTNWTRVHTNTHKIKHTHKHTHTNTNTHLQTYILQSKSKLFEQCPGSKQFNKLKDISPSFQQKLRKASLKVDCAQKRQALLNTIMDQIYFVGLQLVIRSILKFSLIENYEILLNTAVLPRNLLDPTQLSCEKIQKLAMNYNGYLQKEVLLKD